MQDTATKQALKHEHERSSVSMSGQAGVRQNSAAAQCRYPIVACVCCHALLRIKCRAFAEAWA
eukprot:scaffold165443_cov15-Tisochrysis_lutea.AAC.1